MIKKMITVSAMALLIGTNVAFLIEKQISYEQISKNQILIEKQNKQIEALLKKVAVLKKDLYSNSREINNLRKGVFESDKQTKKQIENMQDDITTFKNDSTAFIIRKLDTKNEKTR